MARTITISIEEVVTKKMTIDAARAADVDLTDDDQVFELFDSFEYDHHPMNYAVHEREISVTHDTNPLPVPDDTPGLLPQYALSTDPEVIAAVAHNDAERVRFQAFAKQLSQHYLGRDDAAVGHSGPIKPYVTGLRVSAEEFERLPGKWTKRDKGITRPYRDNNESARFSFPTDIKEVPGRPGLLWGGGEGYFGRGDMFVVDGVAYSGVAFPPCEEIAGARRWIETTPSRIYDALKARNKEGQS